VFQLEKTLCLSASPGLNEMSLSIIPLLKSAEWAEQAVEQNLLVSPLPIENAASGVGAPVMAYGVDQAESVVFLPASESNKQKISAIHDAALASLRQRLSHLDWGRLGEGEELGDILAFADDFNAAECLLLPERLLEAHALLDSSALLACTPKRGLLLVCRYRKEKEAIEAFLGLCHEIYYEEGNEPISSIVWGVSKGLIKDRMRISEAYLGYLKGRYSPAPSQPSEALADAVDEQPVAKNEGAAEAGALYSPGQVAFMTLFGTILAGLYGIFRNYRARGAVAAARRTVVAGFALVPLSVLSFLALPSSAYDRLFPVLSAILVGGGCKLVQGRMLKEAQAEGARLHRVGNQCLVIVVSLLVMLPLVAILVLSFEFDPTV
jgi:hypothetical protein